MNDSNDITSDKPLINFTTLIYILQGLSFFLGITALVAIILNYVRMDAVRGTWLESHFRWQIRTFWFGLLWTVIGALTMIIGVGFVIFFFIYLWIIYRIIKGWMNLNDRLPMYMVKEKKEIP